MPKGEVEVLLDRVRELAETGTMREIEQAVIELRMARLKTVPKAAESLGLSLPTVYGKVRKYGLAAVRREATEARKGDKGGRSA